MRCVCLRFFAVMIFFAAMLTVVSCVSSPHIPYAPPSPLAGTSFAPFPNPDSRYLADRAEVLTAAQQDALNDLLHSAEQRSGVRIVVATVLSVKDYPDAPNDSVESFGKGLFRAYQIGDNGVLFLLALKDREARIQLGVDYAHTRDADMQKIVDDVIIPRGRQGDMSGALLEGVPALVKAFSAP